jgi:hypothetical protein
VNVNRKIQTSSESSIAIQQVRLDCADTRVPAVGR